MVKNMLEKGGVLATEENRPSTFKHKVMRDK